MKLALIGCTLLLSTIALPTSPGNGNAKHPELPQVEELTIGGRNAEKGEFPYQVSIQRRFGGHFCGGSLISHHTVLTAAHCTAAYEVDEIWVVAGERILNIGEGSEQSRSVDRIISHPKFHTFAGFPINDVAILLLKEPMKFNEYVKNIKLSHPSHLPTGIATLSGWGYASKYKNIISQVLQTAEISLLNHSVCLPAWERKNMFEMPDSILCSGPLDGSKGPCHGDSGGPLVQNGVLVGIVSFAFSGCAAIDYPSGFTRVSAFTDWILKEDSNIRRSKLHPFTTPQYREDYRDDYEDY